MIISPVVEIDNIWWPKRVTGRAIKADSVVVIPNGGRDDLMIVKLASGGYISSRDISKFAYLPGNYPWMDGTIKALVKLGAISKDAAEAHLKICEDRSAAREKQYTADTLAKISKETGLALTKAQRRFVDTHGTEKRGVVL